MYIHHHRGIIPPPHPMGGGWEHGTRDHIYNIYVYVLSVYNIAVAMENGPFSSMICLSMVLFRRPRGPLEVPKAQAFRVL